jgi:hypothetical protein
VIIKHNPGTRGDKSVCIQGIPAKEHILQEVLADVDATLRQEKGLVQEDACRCLASLVLAGDEVADTVFKFCEKVYLGLSATFECLTSVRSCPC